MAAQNSYLIKPPVTKDEKQEILNIENYISDADKIVIMTPDGQRIQMPLVISQALIEMAKILNKGGSLTLIPMDKELTTQQAADILNISRPYLIKILEQGELAYRKVGTHRKILMKDVINYKSLQQMARKSNIEKMIDISQELGIYDYATKTST